MGGHFLPVKRRRAFPHSKAQSAGFGATAQRMHLALAGPTLRRKRHESAMKAPWTSFWAMASNPDPHMSENAPRPGRPPPSAPIRSAQLSSFFLALGNALI